MNSLIRSYGRILATSFVGLVVFWLLFLIAMPQYFMIDQSLWQKKHSAEAVSVKLEIDKLYNQQSSIQLFELPDAKSEPESAEKHQKIAQLEQQAQALAAKIHDLELVEVQPVKVYAAENYTTMTGLHLKIFIKTIIYSLLVTIFALVFCYPIAYAIAHIVTAKWAALMMLGGVGPDAINELLRVYSWVMILDYRGVLNS